MIVIDASTVLEVLLRTPAAGRVEARIFDRASGQSLHSPELLDVEVARVLWYLVDAGELTHQRAAEAIADLSGLRVRRWPHQPLMARAWRIVPAVTVSDALYLALAEGLRAPLLTRDIRLASATSHEATVEMI